jgi:predicted transcriptional regulator
MNPIADEILMHYGMPRRSGRYPWGSGEDPCQRTEDFIGRLDKLKKQGWTETPENIKKEFGLTTKQFRIEKKIAKDERRSLNVARAKSLKEDGLGETEIGRMMGVNESTVRSWLNAESEARMNRAKETAKFLKEQVDSKGMIDVGTGVERELNISKENLDTALYLLQREGYPVYKGGIPQVTNKGQQTNQKVLCIPGTEHKQIYEYDKVQTINEYVSHDGGETFDKFVYPRSLDSSRLKIRYAEEGGIERDGIVEIRRGVDDLSLGDSHYSQVRILVDGKRYIKGMAVYSDDLPDGVDIVFNTNKKSDVPMDKVLKTVKEDPDNPFGSLIKPGGQSYYTDKDGNRQLSLINKTRDEGDWSEWKDALPSQFLGKQSLSMAKKQLDLARADKAAEYDELCSLTNPTVKKHLLSKFADSCDSAAVHLQAAALPGQKYHVIIPVNSLKDNEVYAPGYESGTKLALVRYPHGGTFEIPILTVNNKNQLARQLIGTDSIDAVGINSKNAERLSGADFDGDTVMCIPTHDRGGKVKVTSTPPLKGLEGFDPKTAYGPDTYKGRDIKIMKNTGTEMGKISNLITDMTLAGASQDELARAVRHSMVVIDAEKHKLDYKKSEADNNIAALRKEYQRHVDEDGNVRYGGASTILSRSKGETSVLKRQGTPKTNIKGEPWYDPDKPEGSLIYKTAEDVEYTVRKINKRTGEVTETTKYKKQQSTRMAETDDARTLVSEGRHPMELLYADYANNMKSMANQARKEVYTTGDIKYSPTAKANYQTEVDSLMSKLNTALLNTTRERAAQRKANVEVQSKQKDDPNMKPGDVKKASQRAISKYRTEVGSVSRRDRSIQISDREWEAIQAGAISPTKLKQILNNTDIDSLRQRATPRSTSSVNQAKANRIKAMSASNYTIQEIADKLGISKSAVSQCLKGEN